MRQRPVSPLKLACEQVTDERSALLLELARQERSLSELREKKKELESQIRSAENNLHAAKKQLSSGSSPLKPVSGNIVRPYVYKEKEMETLQNLADGVSAIWKDVLGATIGDQAAT